MKFVEKRGYAPFLTFAPDKHKPVYNWFYYKEAFSREFVFGIMDELRMREPFLDPFCGIGTTLLACKEKNVAATGFDASPLAILASKVKTEDYGEEELDEIEKEIKKMEKTKWKKPVWKWKFELFPPARAFPKNNFEDALFLRELVEEVAGEKIRCFFLLALASIIPETSLTLKDGGVLKIVRKKHLPPLKGFFFRKARRMLKDLGENKIVGRKPVVEEGDARRIPLENNSINSVITSPPYLNNVDYTKIYGLELSLLFGEEKTREVRKKSLRSFIGLDAGGLEEIEGIDLSGMPLVAKNYFADMKKVLGETHRVLRAGGKAAFVVGNSVLPQGNIEVDAILAEIAESIGFGSEIWVGNVEYADVPVKGKKPARESIVVLEKS
jgi:SAM-dependent methyltransferase